MICNLQQNLAWNFVELIYRQPNHMFSYNLFPIADYNAKFNGGTFKNDQVSTENKISFLRKHRI